ncbi:MAG: GGDEF domain-containing protein [Halopseudomonas sp.]
MPERLQPLQYLLLPLIILGGVYVYLPQLPPFSSPWEELLPSVPYLLGGLIALLGWHFNSGRSLLACILILLTNLSLRQPFEPLYQQTLLVLLPLNMAQIAWYRERGVLSPTALVRLAWIAAQIAAVTAAIHYHPEQLLQGLNFHPQQLPELPLPFVVLSTLAIAGLAVLARLLSQQDRFDAYLLISVVVSCGLILLPIPQRDLSLVISVLLALWLFSLFRHSHSLAYLDDLTGLPGRRALNEHLTRLGKQHCLAMLDVDHFKKFNDKHGHDVGDQVLKLVASKIAKVRQGKGYRYGGEEFCVVFAGRKLEQTLEPLEELRQAIEDARLQLRSAKRPQSNDQGKKQRGTAGAKSSSVSVTISIGIAEHQPKQNTLKAADKALYKAKAAGRNRVCH